MSFRCDDCCFQPAPSTLSRMRDHLIVHVLRYHSQGPEPVCDECELSFTSKNKQNLWAHFKARHAWALKSRDCSSDYALCDDCSQKRRRKPALYQHIRSNHQLAVGASLREAVCDDCLLSLRRKEALSAHAARVHKTCSEKQHLADDRRIYCDQCNHISTSKTGQAQRALYFHFLASHRLNDRQNSVSMACDYCNAPFLRQHGFLIHLKVHHSSNYRQKKNAYNCDNCRASLRRAEAFAHWLRNHCGHPLVALETLSVIKNRRAVSCDDCKDTQNNRLIGKTNIWKHYATVHCAKIVRSQLWKICDVCQRLCFTKIHLHSHYHRTHSSRQLGTTARPFGCDVCGMPFCGKQGLAYHWTAKHSHSSPLTKALLSEWRAANAEKRRARVRCDDCGLSRLKTGLQRHYLAHRKGRSKNQ